MTRIADILTGATPVPGGFRVTVPSGWMQGRTAYGGFSAALALHAAQLSETDLPPLRSATVNFVGPAAGEITVIATRLRRGRTAAFIQADVTSEAGLACRVTFVFMAAQPSRVSLDQAPLAPSAPPLPEEEVYTGPEGFFTGNFNYVDRKDALGDAEWLRWIQLRDYDGLDPMVEIMAVGDGLPPAAFKLLGKDIVPVSSLTWIVNMLTPKPETEGGWWLLSANADVAQGGCSSQTMRVWNSHGKLVAEGMQSVAIFG